MTTTVTATTIYDCTIEQAFQTPILGDIRRVHTGFAGLIPYVTHCTKGENWGLPGCTKYVFVAPSFIQNGGWMFDDTVLERVENRYWRLEVGNFQVWTMGFTTFVGEWAVFTKLYHKR
jgi:hypothetical protein